MATTENDKDLEETKRIMERLVKQPPQPHEKAAKDKAEEKPAKKSDKKG